MAKKSFIEYLLEPGSDEAELYAAIRAIVGASAFDRFKGVWAAQPYEASDLVRYQTGLWVATADVLATDVPTVSPLWVLLIDLAEFVDGVNFDVAVPNIAARAAYDNMAPPFTVAVSDTAGAGDGRSALYRRIGAAGNWSAPLYIEGLRGLQGVPGTNGTNGAPGPGVATGGTTGMVLAKQSDSNFDTVWIAPPAPPNGSVTRAKLATALAQSIPRSVYEFGAAGDGATEDAYVFGSIDGDASAPEYLLTAGVFLIGVTTSMNKPVRIMPGARIKVPNGITLTINAEIIAAKSQKIFELVGTGKVVLDGAKNEIGYPEWWGALPDGATNCVAAINACIVNCPITQLGYGTYRVDDTVQMTTAHRKLRGLGKTWTTGGRGTRIAINHASKSVILQGKVSNPGTINDHLLHTYIEDLCVDRFLQIDSAGTCYGIESKWVLFAGIHRCEGIQHKVPFYSEGQVQPHYTECYAFRHSVGTNPAVDSFYGWFLNGASGLGAAGGNASVYIDDCTAACGLTPAQCPTNAGFGFAGPSADTFLRRWEVTSCQRAVIVQGGGAYSGDADIHIQDGVGDGLQVGGIFINALGLSGIVKHTGNYYAPAGGVASFTGILVIGCRGMIASHNNQVVGWPSADTTGVSLSDSYGVDIVGDMLLDCLNGVIVDLSANNNIQPNLKNQQIVAQRGVWVKGSSSYNYIAPTAGIMNGGKMGFGVELDNTTSKNEVNPTRMTNTISARVVINSVSITTTGPQANGNIVSGVL